MSEQLIFEDPALEACSEQERLFVLAYVHHGQTSFCNATRSAEAAGYKASTSDSLRAQGYQLKNRPHVQAAIRELLNRHVMSTEEALVRLSDLIRGAMALLVDIDEVVDEQGELRYEMRMNVAKAIHNGLGHAIKEMRVTTQTTEEGTTTTTWVKVPDPLQAMRLYFRVMIDLGLGEEESNRDRREESNYDRRDFWEKLERRIHES